MKNITIGLVATVLLVLFTASSFGRQKQALIFELRIYHFENSKQAKLLDTHVRETLFPAMRAMGSGPLGAFKPRQGQPGADSTLFVLIPHESLAAFEKARIMPLKDEEPPYERMELILMKAFDSFPGLGIPEIMTGRTERVYELRSYESATEFLYHRKVAMFNEGEADIFVRLGFQPVFFGDVIAGSKMPRLIYMTTHASEDEQAQHWKAFGKDPKWEEMKGMERYKNTVSHIDKYMLYPTPYSDF